MQPSKLEALKTDYKQASISAKDIFLPPYKENLTGDQIARERNNYIAQVVEQDS